ncbi:unnamed protein product, partial [Mesorhabditis belari]|uniref:G2/mitotic-specific cyclin-B3 n=1 Tax=Mesorhabditis belari TaxID=2138241 RepID=A0AAF3J7V0_9BILA
MLRSRNTNIVAKNTGAAAGKNAAVDPPAKRNVANNQIVLEKRGAPEHGSGEPQPKRAVLHEIHEGIDGILIDSQKRTETKRTRRSNSSKDSSQTFTDSDSDIQVLDVTLPKRVDPCPEFDFDQQCAREHDEHAVPEFAADIFEYSRSREKNFMVGNYIKRLKHYTPQIRARVVDWMVEMQESFELNHETLYLSVKLWDLYMAQTSEVNLTDVSGQLIASVCIFVASKFDERSPPLIDDFLYICQDRFEREAFITCEMKLLDVIGFDLGCPLSYVYLRRLARVTSTGMGTLTLSRYILETSLCYYEFVGVRESLLASGAFYLALKMENESAQWTPILHKYSGYSLAEIEPFVDELNLMLHRIRNHIDDEAKTVQSKYSHEVFHSVALIPLLPCNFQSPPRNNKKTSIKH